MYLRDYNNKEKIENVIKVFMELGCNKESAVSLLVNNLGLIGYTPEELSKKLNIILNGNRIYAMLFCDGNKYRWSIYNEKDNTFTTFRGISEEKSILYGDTKAQNKDYVVELVLEYLNNPKFKKYININDDASLEDKINNYKNLNINKEGYHIK